MEATMLKKLILFVCCALLPIHNFCMKIPVKNVALAGGIGGADLGLSYVLVNIAHGEHVEPKDVLLVTALGSLLGVGCLGGVYAVSLYKKWLAKTFNTKPSVKKKIAIDSIAFGAGAVTTFGPALGLVGALALASKVYPTLAFDPSLREIITGFALAAFPVGAATGILKTMLDLAEGKKLIRKHGTEALHNAWDLDIAEYCSALGALVNSKDSTGKTPLHWAASFRDKDIVEYLIRQGADVNATDNNGRTPLHKAAGGGNIEALIHLINQGADIKAKDNDGKTPLHSAAGSSEDNKKIKEIVAYLIEQGADVNALDNKGKTSLHEATDSGNKEALVYLINQGADIKAKGNDGKTPLHRAAGSSKDNKEIVAYLIQQGSDLNATNKYGRTPLHEAAYKGNKEALAHLIERGAHINTQDNYGETPLHRAAGSYKDTQEIKEIVAYLIEHGADLRAKDNYGSTLLHEAARNGNSTLLESLMYEHLFPPDFPMSRLVTPRFFFPTLRLGISHVGQSLKAKCLKAVLQHPVGYKHIAHGLPALGNWSFDMLAEYAPLQLQKELAQRWKQQENYDPLTSFLTAHCNRHLARIKDLILMKTRWHETVRDIAQAHNYQGMMNLLDQICHANTTDELDPEWQELMRRNFKKRLAIN